MTGPLPPDGERLLDDRYRLGARLGVGGVAEVYRAFDERLHRDVAVKIFRGDVADQLHRHEDEMRTLARLDHPALVTVLDAGEDAETRQPYLVMTLIDGPTLAEELRHGPLPPDQVAEIGATLAGALSYVHAQGLVHRDVKPANVLISRDGRAHLTDFGIARLVNASHVTRTGDVVGTPAYFAPEQVTGEAVGPPADVYALGLVLLECLTGHREYDGTPMESALARVNRPPAIPAALSPAWRDVLAGMTSNVASQRLTAGQVADRLARLAGTDPGTATVALGGVAAAPTVAMPPVGAPPATTVMPPTSAMPPTTQTASQQPPSSGGGRGRTVLLTIIVLLLVAGAAVAAVLTLGKNSKHHQGASASCRDGVPSLIQPKLESDLQALENAVCSTTISRKASNALSPYLVKLGDAVGAKSTTGLQSARNAMAETIASQTAAGHLSQQRSVNISNALGQFYSDAYARLNKPKPTHSPTTSPSSTPSSTPTTSPPSTPTTSPPSTPTTPTTSAPASPPLSNPPSSASPKTTISVGL